MVKLSHSVIETLKTQTRGSVLLPEDPGYEASRKIWNAMIDRRPAGILQCAGVADVMLAVSVARDNGVLVSVRGGGHNIAGSALCDDGLLIDLSAMKSVHINPDTRRAYVEPGASLGDFDHEAQAFGLATSLGINSTTGVAGLTLGGGFGWLTRKHGLTVDNLISVEIITADAKRMRASADENSDLFWAVRGGGGNFGIVTMFEFQLHPVGPEILAGLIVYPFEDAETVLNAYRRFVDNMHADLNVWVVLRQAPPLPFLPEAVHGKDVVILAVFFDGDPVQGMSVIEPLRSLGQPCGEHIGPMPFKAWQKAFDPLLTPGARNYWKSHNFAELSDGAIATAIEFADKLPSPQCETFIALLGGQSSRVTPDATAYSARDTRFVMNMHARWESDQQDQSCIAWAREFFAKVEPFATGSVYVNFMTEEEVERIPSAYGVNQNRLEKIKKKYDPDNFFRVNQNIKPSA
ncbi:MAG: FAD-binding oxidoreductase [Deltaproteobacteria bacterium]|nr:FAD-binding oxidoreductase [Deltaproteobacteria bacterium]